MKTLFIGGVKSGKSRLAEAYILAHSVQKPVYLATAECIDEEMADRINDHQQRRRDRFLTVEEPLNLVQTVAECTAPVLIECVTMWLNNKLYYQHPEESILQELEMVLSLTQDIVFVQNEVGLGVIPDNPLTRKFADLSGKSAQLLASRCDKVIYCCAGLPLTLK